MIRVIGSKLTSTSSRCVVVWTSRCVWDMGESLLLAGGQARG